jgi:hypothetical protein
MMHRGGTCMQAGRAEATKNRFPAFAGNLFFTARDKPLAHTALRQRSFQPLLRQPFEELLGGFLAAHLLADALDGAVVGQAFAQLVVGFASLQ